MFLLRVWIATAAFGASLVAQAGAAQTAPVPPKEVAGIPVNYDEALVGDYKLPNPLHLENGATVRDAKTWYQKRRPEIVRLFEQNQFGRSPGAPAHITYDTFDAGTPAFGGKAIRKQTTIYFSADKTGPKMDLLVYLPAKAKTPSPLLLNISFSANSTTIDDPGVKEGEIWDKDHNKVPARQGRAFGKVDVVPLLDAGFGFATVYYGDIEPDFDGGLKYGVRALYLKPGQTQPEPDEWGAIAAWGWGLSRALDYLEQDPKVDAKRVALYGASRLGKTVLWAGARDTRFAAVIACCSGEGGAALSRRNYGETIAHLTAPGRFPYQFATNYEKFAKHVNELPVDGNMLVALMAPARFCCKRATPITGPIQRASSWLKEQPTRSTRYWVSKSLDTNEWPPAGTLVLHTLAYYMHSGGHGTLPSDWKVFLEFLTTQLGPAKNN